MRPRPRFVAVVVAWIIAAIAAPLLRAQDAPHLVSMELRDAALRVVVDLLARQSGKNILLAADVDEDALEYRGVAFNRRPGSGP